MVGNFPRHLGRRHKEEEEVKEFLRLSLRDPKRKQILNLLRRRGKFETFVVQKKPPKSKRCEVETLPCQYCKGFFSKNYLFRHVKKCVVKTTIKKSIRENTTAVGQSVMAAALDAHNVLPKMEIYEKVFSRMNADKCSFVVKTDVLISAYGEWYFKKHNRDQMALVCSNKMRELGYLLINMRERLNQPNMTMVDVINPMYFDDCIECAKEIAGFDPVTKTYRAASLAMHVGTTLKHAASLCKRLIVQRYPPIKFPAEDENEEEEKREKKKKLVSEFKELVTDMWNTDITSLAMKTLGEKRLEKPKLIPLTTNVLKFKTFVETEAAKAAAILRANKRDEDAYRRIVDCTLTLTICYNRRRIGDVQYVPFLDYFKNFDKITNQEELLATLTPSERALTNSCKRVKTLGKGSRPVLILFPEKLQNLMNVMLESRNELVPPDNIYLFAYSNTQKHWVRGDITIRNLAQESGIPDPHLISGNSLRKQIATVVQLLHLSPTDEAEFAKFMGHTEKTHNEFYK